MTLLEALSRLRLNPLRDVSIPYLWPNSELIGYLNEIRDEFCEETQVMKDSETPEICQIIIGVVAANMARGTNAATLKVVTAFDFINQSKKYTFPVTDNIAMTACAVQPISTYCRYLICSDADNTVTVQKGVDSTTAAGAYLPLMTEGLTPIGMLLIQTNASNTFTSGTTSLNGTGITATFESSLSKFSKDSRIIRINSAEPANTTDPLDIKDKHWMNQKVSGWKDRDPNGPLALINLAKTGQYQVWPSPKYPEQILLTVSRRPLQDVGLTLITSTFTTALDITPTTRTIHRDSGSFITDGYTVGAEITLTGATDSSNNATYTINSLSAGSIVTAEAILGAVQSNGPGVITTVDLSEDLEIPEEYVKRLYNGIAQLAFSKRDAKVLDVDKANDHGAKWLKDIEMTKRSLIRENATNDTHQLPGGLLP